MSGETKRVPWCARCKGSEDLQPRAPGDFMCVRCRSMQTEVFKIAIDPCDQLIVEILGDDRARQESAPKYPLAKPVGTKVLAGIRLAMDGRGGPDRVKGLVAALLPGEREIVMNAIRERDGAR